MQAASLAYMLAQKRMGFRVDDANVKFIPLHVHGLSNPTGWQAVISSVHFNAAIQMDSSFAELVIAERFDRQWKQRRFFLGEHRRNLSLRCAMDARVGPAQFPLIEIGLSGIQRFKAQSFERCFLSMSD